MSIEYTNPENKFFSSWIVSGKEAHIIIDSLSKKNNREISKAKMERARKALQMNYIEKSENKVETKVPAEVYSRISGYIRPVFTNGKKGQWNPGKTQEFKERKFAKVTK